MNALSAGIKYFYITYSYVIAKFYQLYSYFRVNIHIKDEIRNSIEFSMSNTILDTDMKTRVILPSILTKTAPVEQILHRTGAPFDEYYKNHKNLQNH